MPKHPSQCFRRILFIPIKGNQILLFAEYSGIFRFYLSIHEIRSNNRVGPTLWSFSNGLDGHPDIYDLVPIKSTENALGIAFGAECHDHWKLFDISTTSSDASDNFPLIESGRIDHDPKPKEWERVHNNDLGLSENFMQSCGTCSNVLCKSYGSLTGAFYQTQRWGLQNQTFAIRIFVAQTMCTLPSLPASIFLLTQKSPLSFHQHLHFLLMGSNLLWLWVAAEGLFVISEAKFL